MQTHDQLVKKLMARPGVRAEVDRLELALATGKRSPSQVTLRMYVNARGRRLVLRVT